MIEIAYVWYFAADDSNTTVSRSNKQAKANDINVQESACLSILLFGGIVCASEMSEPERVPHFITPYLPHLSGLMTYYAADLTICEALLKLFRDYAERYLSMLDRDQCKSLFAKIDINGNGSLDRQEI